MSTLDRLKPLSKEQLELIHQKTVTVLEKTGMRFCSEEAREIFKRHNFRVDGEIVYIPEEAVEKALKTIPSQFVVRARNPENDLVIGGDNFAFSNNAGAPFILDYNGTCRKSNIKDYHNSLKLNQVLDGIDYNREMVSSGGEIHPENTLLYELLWQLKLTDKPVNCVFGEGIDLLAIAFGIDRDRMKEDARKGIAYGIGNVNPRSPLTLEGSQCQRIIDLCTNGIPVCISPMPIAGMTGPVTLPGLLIAQNAEIIGPTVLSQLVNPGAPVVYGILGTIAGMKTMVAPTAAPEVGIIEYASAQIAAFYGMPTRGDVGVSDANTVDFQAGVESAFHFVNAIRSGINLMPGLGSLGSRCIGSLEKLVLDAEIAGFVKRLVRPMQFTEETMAVEVIMKVGHNQHYIAEDHTYRHFRTEFYEPAITVRENYKVWEEKGRKDSWQRAHEKVNELLRSYRKPDLDRSVERDMDRYAAEHYPVPQLLRNPTE